MRQYLETKQKAGDALLFFRLGDFYEMFFEDAEIASRELELVLTGKDCGMGERAPMCGIPYHAALSYIGRLVGAGYKVAVCEQLEDPATAKGIVKRDIIKIYTPGTVTDERMLEQKNNSYIASVFGINKLFGFAVADITTGELKYTSITIGATIVHVKDELAKFAPREIILNAGNNAKDEIANAAKVISGAFVNVLDDEVFDLEKGKKSLEILAKGKNGADDLSIRAVEGLLYYLRDTQKSELDGILEPEYYRANEFMAIDAQSRRNLELTETMRDKKKTGTLLWVLDKTSTAMGGRLLRRWVEEPLIDKTAIDMRLDGVSELLDKFMLRSELMEYLNGVYDVERLANKISMGNVNAKELLSLKISLGKLPDIKALLKNAESEILKELGEGIDTLPELFDLLERGINEEPPVVITEGNIIKDGFSEEIDKYREAAKNGKSWLSELELKEKELTGIKKLKIGYNRVFGYYIEVSNSFLPEVPHDRFIRKQTLSTGERYITEELKSMEDTILGAEERLVKREYELFTAIRGECNNHCDVLKSNAQIIAALDALCSLATVAERENYVRPEITDECVIDIKNGRHPVVEKMPGCDSFVPNNGYLDDKEDTLLVITGPNMAGKSTYMRQMALIVLMAQVGSFVPAGSAKIGICDKIFTRVGASDDLAQGQSTFMVEMCEVANIVSNATDRSLLILDEIGRGTSTFDGLSIAWAVLEYIVDNIKARTLFATHYHELTELEGKIPSVKNYCVTVKKNGDEITFLRKIKRGGADGSYGIAVAKLAGVPKAITLRANEILAELERQDVGKTELKLAKNRSKQAESGPDLFAFATATAMQDDIIESLKSMNVQEMTPIECMNALYDLIQRANNRK